MKLFSLIVLLGSVASSHSSFAGTQSSCYYNGDPFSGDDSYGACQPGFQESCQKIGTYGGDGCYCCLPSTLDIEVLHVDPPTETFTGMAASRSQVAGAPCQSVTLPSSVDAETDADQQAAAHCLDLKLKSVRVSDYQFSTNYCVATGQGYRYQADYLYAEAQYACE